MELNIINTIAAFLSLAIFSFLWKDNPLYKLAEHLVVGVSAGYWLITLFNTTMVPKLYDPLNRFLHGNSQSILDPLVIIPAVLGLLLFTRFVPKYSWISRIPMAYILGVGSGAAIPLLLQASVVQQIYPTISVFLPGATAGTGPMINNLLVLFGVTCGLIYFFFSARHVGILGGVSRIGIWLLMIGFGASFGYTVMSRISLLYGRIDFLVHRWAEPLVRAVLG